MGLELEWYVIDQATGSGVDDLIRSEYLVALKARCVQTSLPLYSYGTEDGHGQVEAALPHRRDLHELITDTARLRDLAHMSAQAMGLEALFTAKPFARDYGSGLHVHLHLESPDGTWLYHKQGEELSEPLSHSIGGLLATMEAALPIFAGVPEAFARYTPGWNAPVNASWGSNNRSTALRLPDTSGAQQGMEAILAHPPTTARRIEHRAASAQADVGAVIVAILEGISHGLEHHTHAPAPVHGDASASRARFTLA